MHRRATRRRSINSRSTSRTGGWFAAAGIVRAMATWIPRRSGTTETGHGSLTWLDGGAGGRSPVAASQRARANCPNATAAPPSTSIWTSWNGRHDVPSDSILLSGWSMRCSCVSHRHWAKSKPPTNATASSTITTFWCWEAPTGCVSSFQKWRRRCVIRRRGSHHWRSLK